MSSLTYHPVWEAQVSIAEKDKFQTFASSHPIKEHEFISVSYLIKRKKNGGIVATVFMQNGFNHSLHLNTIKVYLLNDNHEVIAEEVFQPNLVLPAYSTMPWSFVFSARSVLLEEKIDAHSTSINIENLSN